MYRQLVTILIMLFMSCDYATVDEPQAPPPDEEEVTECERSIQLRTSIYEFIDLDTKAMRHPFIRGWFNGDKQWEVVLFDSLQIDEREMYIVSLKPTNTTFADFPDDDVQCYLFIDKATDLLYRYRFTITPFDGICIFNKDNTSESFLFGIFSVIGDLNMETLGETTFNSLVGWVETTVCFPFSSENLRWFGCHQSISNGRYNPEYNRDLVGLAVWKDDDGSTNVEIRNPYKLFE